MSRCVIDIYPHGLEKPPAKLVFPSLEEKDRYFTEEYNFCLKEHQAYNSAMTLAARKEAKTALYQKRVRFAMKKGYAPKPSDNQYWIPQANHTPTSTA